MNIILKMRALLRNRPTEAVIRAIVTKFRTKISLLDIKRPTRLRRVQTEENIAAVSASVNDGHQLSIRVFKKTLPRATQNA